MPPNTESTDRLLSNFVPYYSVTGPKSPPGSIHLSPIINSPTSTFEQDGLSPPGSPPIEPGPDHLTCFATSRTVACLSHKGSQIGAGLLLWGGGGTTALALFAGIGYPPVGFAIMCAGGGVSLLSTTVSALRENAKHDSTACSITSNVLQSIATTVFAPPLAVGALFRK